MDPKQDVVAAEAEFRRSLADAHATCLYADFLVYKMKARIERMTARSRSNRPPQNASH